ncbi:alpha/beta fold hydrolase [Plantactinospora endophytica]|uniref:Alpha/beta hydrolase n=1 Tax=Plantactinospora endophytica TaxID=673535 RepID=A0ABQ4ED50_9ACTN|nr:hypothetical protein Pen02_75910 [Plantactinospora endophytica]
MARHPLVTTVEVPDAGHDLHVDSPDLWRNALADFLDISPPSLDVTTPRRTGGHDAEVGATAEREDGGGDPADVRT